MIEILLVAQWWLLFFFIGIAFLPITFFLFPKFYDVGYIFSKVLGLALLSYIILVLGITHLVEFSRVSSISLLAILGIINYVFLFSKLHKKGLEQNFLSILKNKWWIFLFEEIVFLVGLLFWAHIRGYEPSIHGLEKYMDFGFVNSILRSSYFPPKDMWFTPHSINYYYFGHLVTAVITKILDIPSNYSFNLMLANLFAFTFTCSFSIGLTLLSTILPGNTTHMLKRVFSTIKVFLGSLFIAFLVTLAGNLHTIYIFFDKYNTESPLPFWQQPLAFASFPNSYWYPNATRFIHNTIHEFPLYSFVVSDLHGHVLDIPFVLLTIALLFSTILKYKHAEGLTRSWKVAAGNLLPISFLLAILYMTNAWDGMIYYGLTVFTIVFLYKNEFVSLYRTQAHFKTKVIRAFDIALLPLLVVITAVLFTLPFSLRFSPASIVHGIGVLCSPKFLIDRAQLGPFLFEQNHCQRSPLWQLLILYGFFYFWVILFITFLFKTIRSKVKDANSIDIFILLLIIVGTVLIIIPEFLYMKDIYPAHYRANTMFKLVYQSFIMLSLVSGYAIILCIKNLKEEIRTIKYSRIPKIFLFLIFMAIGGVGIILVSAYPYFAIKSYYGDLKTYKGLDGTVYLKPLYPTDYNAILWLNKRIKGQPVILEAQGDSYTDYARVSANTGLPTVLGWTVHEWLWRGSYDVPSPRITDVQTLYESTDIDSTKKLLKEYQISLVFVGDLERQKYPKLDEEKFKSLGKIIYQNGQTHIYKIN